jgi:hypothetical protein
MNRPAVRVVLLVLAVLLVLGGGAGAFAWYKLAQLKQQLLTQLGDAIGAQVSVASVSLDVLKGELHAAGITLTNTQSSAPWETGDISQLTVRFKLRDLLNPTLPLSLDVDSWNVVLHSALRTAETPPGTPDAEPAPAAAPSGGNGAPGRVRVTHITGHNGTVEFDFSDDRKMVASGVDFDASDNGADVWTTHVHLASIKAETLDAGPGSVEIRGEPDKLTFSNLVLQVNPGAITGEGDVALSGAHDMHADLKLAQVPLTMLVATQWQVALSGLVTTEVNYTGNDQGGQAQGPIAVEHAKFNVLPWLDRVTSLVGLPPISNVEVDRATAQFAWKDGALHLTDIDVRKNDAARIAGAVDIDAKGNVDGHLKLGLPSTVTARWPQVQTQVFPVALEDYNWADVHLTGSANHLQEDLTPRLVAAGLSSGGNIMNQAAQKATDLLHSLLGR